MSSAEYHQQKHELAARRQAVSSAVKECLENLEGDLSIKVKDLVCELSALYEASASEDMAALADIERTIVAVGKIESKVGRLHSTFESFRDGSANLFNSYPYLNGTPQSQSKRPKHAEDPVQDRPGPENAPCFTTPIHPCPTGDPVFSQEMPPPLVDKRPMKTRCKGTKMEFDHD